MKKIYGLTLVTLLSLNFSFAQHQNVMISTSNSPEEPSIYVNPKNTDHIVGGANINNVYTLSMVVIHGMRIF